MQANTLPDDLTASIDAFVQAVQQVGIITLIAFLIGALVMASRALTATRRYRSRGRR